MNSKLKDSGGALLFLGFILLMLFLSVFFLHALLWLVEKLYPIVELLAILATFLLLPVCIVAAVAPKARGFFGEWVIGTSYLIGATVWMWSTMTVYQIWGIAALVIGLILSGVGTVPVVLLALLTKGEFALFFETLTTVVIVFAVRFLGIWIISKKPIEVDPLIALYAGEFEQARKRAVDAYKE